jgi:hypothetical protein
LPVELPSVDDGVVADRDSALVVVLNDFVFGFLGSTADDESVARSKNGNGVFADVSEPDVGQSARA